MQGEGDQQMVWDTGANISEPHQPQHLRDLTLGEGATLLENIPRNRLKDVVPYDENRVKITNDKDNKFGYVNASHISATVGSSQVC